MKRRRGITEGASLRSSRGHVDVITWVNVYPDIGGILLLLHPIAPTRRLISHANTVSFPHRRPGARCWPSLRKHPRSWNSAYRVHRPAPAVENKKKRKKKVACLRPKFVWDDLGLLFYSVSLLLRCCTSRDARTSFVLRIRERLLCELKFSLHLGVWVGFFFPKSFN